MMQWRQWLRWWLAATTPVHHAPTPAATKATDGADFSPSQAVALLHHPAADHPANAAQISRAARRLQQEVGNHGVQLLASERGQALVPDLQRNLGSAANADLTDVRIHTGAAGAEVAQAAGADAVTVGHDIAFAAGKYAPETATGQQLLAHEVAHTVQAGSGEAGNVAQLEAEARTDRSPTPGAAGLGQVLRQPAGESASTQQPPAKAPAKPTPAPPPPNPLRGLSTFQIVDYRTETAVQAALAHSSLWPYIGGKVERGVKVEGRVTYLDQKDFEAAYIAHASRSGDAMEKAQSVRGFFDPATQRIILAKPPTLEALLHEAIHRFADRSFRQVFGGGMDEGVTQFFTNHVLQEYGLAAGRAYPKQVIAGNALAGTVGFETLALGYFLGPGVTVLRALIQRGRGFDAGAFARAVRAENADWQQVADMITGTP